MSNDDKFSSKFGIIAVAAGSAVGLGNLWGFPYKAGVAGGGAFVLAYIICIVVVGHMIMKSELIIGRMAKSSPISAYGKVTKNKWFNIAGYLNVFTGFAIFTFYVVIAGWALKYFVDALNGFDFNNVDIMIDSTNLFNETINGFSPIIYSVMVIAATAIICGLGVKNGIEKVSKFLMPGLVVLLIIIVLYNMTLDGFSESFKYLFIPQWDQFFSAKTWAMALGQCFFSLSLGMGALLTYGSYIGDEQDITSIAKQVTIADTVIAILAGLLVFPAVFTFNIEPSSGPSLIFVSLPALFNQMPFGNIVAILFFGLVIFAAITSCISLLELCVSSVMELTKFKRVKSVLLTSLVASVISILMSLSVSNPSINLPLFGTLSDLGLFDQADRFTTLITLPIGGFIIVLIIGYVLDKKIIVSELGKSFSTNKFYFVTKYISLVMLVFLIGVCFVSLFNENIHWV